ncbi:TetR/AcrR family transcriptional regulator [Pseudofrankia asymbiotica]|uniref:HTH tetR-type domain-containing protein n=1 Tax=Pseudofrankia asymbiotica TaxID=1834516 RepID=A0A1V2I699_9ACTN|nr:hypothetical protein BL253_27780 [Pseudofrankia asymbiotica]
MPADLVDVAIQASADLGKDVAEVSVVEIARRAGISRTTLLRRLGGTRGPLDDAVRAAGVDPGGQPPVRQRAIEAGGRLVAEQGLGALTLEAVASAADCSVYSLYAVFGGRLGLLQAIFKRYRPTLDLDDASLGPDLTAAVTEIYRQLARGLTREPAIMPAVLAAILTHPHDPAAAEMITGILPLSPLFRVRDWLVIQIHAGRIRDIPSVLLLQQMIAPLVVHVLLRPFAARTPRLEAPELDRACVILAENFVRAVAADG